MMAMANMGVEVNFAPAAPAANARPSAMRLLVPREHGSWGLWLLPLISGAVVGWSARSDSAVPAVLWFFLAATSAFLVHQPFQAWLGHSALRARSLEEKRTALTATLILFALSVLSLIVMTIEGRSLILLVVVVAAGCFCANVLMAGTRLRSLRPIAQIVGALGLTSTAVGAYYAVAGTLDVRAAVLWLASWLFAAAQIAYVQLRLRTVSARSPAERLRAGWKAYVLHLALPMAAAIAAILGQAHWLLALSFVPAAARLALWAVSPPARLHVHRLGFTELIHSLLFAALLVVALLQS